MSRTYRYNRQHESLTSFIKCKKDEYKNWMRGYAVWVEKDPQAYAIELEKVKEKYVEAKRAWRDDPRHNSFPILRLREPARKELVWIPYTDEEVENFIEDDIETFKSWSRDGRFHESTSKSGFRNDAKRFQRLSDRRICKKIIKGELDPDDDYVLRNRKDGKQFIWDWF